MHSRNPRAKIGRYLPSHCDALSTYLLWLRAALVTGHLSVEEHAREEERLECLLAQRGTHDGETYVLNDLAR